MGIFSRKTQEQKLEQALGKVAKEQKHIDRERGQFDSKTMKHKIALAKRGVDVQDATGIVWHHTEDQNSVYMATRPDGVYIYEVALFGAINKLKNVDTIPYGSINSVQFDKGNFKDVIKVVTSGAVYEFETLEHGRFIVDYINERKV